ncbi:uncharacterized protein [Amphiura filiformis]|uniref:uncharacterized protein n=1 Tax=Amphiura filiformis TaxID=82378 RepID=UPI003B211BA9
MSDFDSASLLMVMARFSMFHNGDPASYDIIMKVAGIRNDLSHMGLKDDMNLVDHTVKQYFQNIADFVTCLEGLHPNHFTSAQDVRDRLKEIQSEPITAKMKKDMYLELRQELQSVHQLTTELRRDVQSANQATSWLCRDVQSANQATSELRRDVQSANQATSELRHDVQSVKEATTELRHDVHQATTELRHDVHQETTELRHDMHQATTKLRHDLQSVHQSTNDLTRKVDNLQVVTSDLVSKTVIENESKTEEAPDEILMECQEQLRAYYINSLCKIPLFPGDFDSCVDLQDIYTKVSIEIKLPKPCRPVKMPLSSYDEMFTRRTREGYVYTKLLLSAPAGLGKTTLTAKIAYDWATQLEGSPLRDITLLFVINMRWIDHTSNLESIILNQILPRDTTITPDQVRSMIERYGDRVIVILDAVDESDRGLFNQVESYGNIVELLKGRVMSPCRVLVTTRPWRIAEITRMCKTFTQLELIGFNKEDVREYVRKFFHQKKNLGDSLIAHLDQNPLVDEIASKPLMALLVCIYWHLLFDAIINIMYHPSMANCRNNKNV